MSKFSEETLVFSQDATLAKVRSPNTYEGTVVSVSANIVVSMSKGGKAFFHTLADDVKLTCGGTVCKVEELKAGRKIRVTMKRDDRNVAISIEVLDTNGEVPQRSAN